MSIENAVKALPPDGFDDWALIEQYQEELSDIKGQLPNLYDELSQHEPEGEGALFDLYSRLKGRHFSCCHEARKILNPHSVPAPSSDPGAGVGSAGRRFDRYSKRAVIPPPVVLCRHLS